MMKVKNCTDKTIAIVCTVAKSIGEDYYIELEPNETTYLKEGYYPETFQDNEGWYISNIGVYALHADEENDLFVISSPSHEEIRQLEKMERKFEELKNKILGFGKF